MTHSLEKIKQPKQCDHTSVGVIIRNSAGEIALLQRAKFPFGMAPVAGHIDDHGSSEQAAVEEVQEELGVKVALSNLKKTVIENRRVDKKCRRPGGDYHVWNVYEVAEFTGDLKPSTDETRGAGWYNSEQLQQLADRAMAYRGGLIIEEDWQNDPGIEGVWLDFFDELGYVK